MDNLNGIPTTSCQCDHCKGACEFKPGWFAPGEAEQAAELMEMNLQDFFDTYLAVDWWGADARYRQDIYVLAPVTKPHGWAGTEYPANPKGKCVFFVNGLCKIYAARPIEYKVHHHNLTENQLAPLHLAVAKLWVDHQGQIRELLDRDPQMPEYDFMDGLFW